MAEYTIDKIEYGNNIYKLEGEIYYDNNYLVSKSTNNVLITNDNLAAYAGDINKTAYLLIVVGSGASLFANGSVMSFQTFATQATSGLEKLSVQVLNGASGLTTAQARNFIISEIDMTAASVRLTSVDNGTIYTVDLQDTGTGLVGTFTSQIIPIKTSDLTNDAHYTAVQIVRW